MNLRLTKLQKQLCNALQDGLPICSRPFDDLAKFLDSDEKTVLQQVRQLGNMKVIRRIGAIINYHSLGRTGTLVAAHIPDENLQGVIEAVNSLQGVSHNYLRQHYYNLWFTLQANSNEQINVALTKLSARFGFCFHSLAVERFFKLDVRFDVSNHQPLLQGIEEVPKSTAIELSKAQKLILSKLQNGLEPIAKPFDFLCGENLKTEDVLRIITELIDKGVIRRIAGIVNHRKLGFSANVLFVCQVSQERIVEAGKALARFGMVSHCYERETFEGWPYNLFAMMHARSMGEIQHVVNRFIKVEKIDSFELLPTVTELKKQPVKHRFC